MLELASHIVETKAGHFNPDKIELLKKKQSGEKIEAPRERAPAKVVNLMDALRRSVEAERGVGEVRKTERQAAGRSSKKAPRSSARQKRAG
jgi:DNA end-binding protein Ku